MPGIDSGPRNVRNPHVQGHPQRRVLRGPPGARLRGGRVGRERGLARALHAPPDDAAGRPRGRPPARGPRVVDLHHQRARRVLVGRAARAPRGGRGGRLHPHPGRDAAPAREPQRRAGRGRDRAHGPERAGERRRPARAGRAPAPTRAAGRAGACAEGWPVGAARPRRDAPRIRRSLARCASVSASISSRPAAVSAISVPRRSPGSGSRATSPAASSLSSRLVIPLDVSIVALVRSVGRSRVPDRRRVASTSCQPGSRPCALYTGSSRSSIARASRETRPTTPIGEWSSSGRSRCHCSRIASTPSRSVISRTLSS